MDKWIKFLKPYAVSMLVGLMLGAYTWASPIKNWTTNEQVTYTDLNNNFNHLHANLGHGHGPIITANDIAANAAIRPEQTTFGSSINRALVFSGSFIRNADGGLPYLPVNAAGSISVTVNAAATGININGSASTGVNSDAGTQIYTVMFRAINDGTGGVNALVDCVEINSSLSSPFIVNAYCSHWVGFDGGVPPPGVAVEVYNNKVQ